MIDHPLALCALIAGMTALAYHLERSYDWARKVGSSLLVIGFGALVANLGLVPTASPVYGAVFGPVTSLAIVWLLFAVDLRDLKAAGPRMLGAFALALAGTVAGVLAGTATLASALGDEGWKLAGVLTGTYTGGSLNFAAVGRAVELSEDLFAATAAADNLLTALWMGATLMIPLWLARRWPAEIPAAAFEAGSADDARTIEESPRFDPVTFLTLVALGLGLSVAADAIATRVGVIPSVVWLTTLALAVGQLPWVRRLRGAMTYGMVALHLFFAVIGIGSRVSQMLAEGPQIFLLVVIVIGVHGLVVYGGGRLFRIDLASLSVASQAAVGGPSTAIGLAAARGWRGLALPGMAVGLLGYAVGNYLGLAAAALARGWLG